MLRKMLLKQQQLNSKCEYRDICRSTERFSFSPGVLGWVSRTALGCPATSAVWEQLVQPETSHLNTQQPLWARKGRGTVPTSPSVRKAACLQRECRHLHTSEQPPGRTVNTDLVWRQENSDFGIFGSCCDIVINGYDLIKREGTAWGNGFQETCI